MFVSKLFRRIAGAGGTRVKKALPGTSIGGKLDKAQLLSQMFLLLFFFLLSSQFDLVGPAVFAKKNVCVILVWRERLSFEAIGS